MNRFLKTVIVIVLISVITCAVGFDSKVCAAAPSYDNEATNIWGSGGQVTFNLKDCSEYLTVTVVVSFDGKISSASGWGFDDYKTSGNEVTATVRADGGNSWGLYSNVGIQVEGSGITTGKVVSVTGSGTYSGTTYNNQSNNQNSNQNNNQNNNQNGTAAEKPDIDSPAVSKYGTAGDDWLTTKGSKIVDMDGNEVWLTGLNWFGYNTGTNLFDGLWSAQLEPSVKAIADHGFNLMRVPMSAELLLQWKSGEYPPANYNHAGNSNLDSFNSLEIFDYVLSLCEENGIKVMIDIHSANTDAAGHNHPVWYTDKISEDQYVEALTWIADRYKNYDTIVAYDLKNEPHGKASETTHAIWNDSDDKDNWKRVAERAGKAILSKNPHALIVIEGIQIYPIDIKSNNFTSTNDEDYYNTWWGGNLMAVKDFPIDFGDEELNRQIVYSPHDYGPLVYEQPWFKGGFDADSLYEDAWHDYWLYIAEEDIAPILIGEWGGFMSGDNLKWMTYLRNLIGKTKLNHTFWCFNANSGDTGGLVKDDFVTWDEDKYELVKSVLWQDGDNKFIGLDHKVALGVNGIALSDYSGTTPEAVFNDTPSDTVEAEIKDDASSEEIRITEGQTTQEEKPADTQETDTGNTGSDAEDTSAKQASSEKKSNNRNVLYFILGLFVAADLIVVFLIFRKKKN